MRGKRMAGGLLAAIMLAGLAAPAGAWDVIGAREVTDRLDYDTIALDGHRKFTRLKVCVYRHPVHFYDLEINFQNGGHQDVQLRARINAGECTRVIDLEGGARDITSIKLVYEETSARKRRATVKIFAE